MKEISELPLENQQSIISKFSKMELGFLQAKSPEGEKILSITEHIVKLLVSSGLDVGDMRTVSANIESILNLNCISPLTFDDSEWCEVGNINGVPKYVNYRLFRVRKTGDLIFPKMHKYHCSMTVVPKTGKEVLNAVFAQGPNFQVSDGKLTGKVVVDWYLQYTKPPKAISIVGKSSDIYIEAKLMVLDNGDMVIYHDSEYPVTEDTILIPFYLSIDEVAGMDIKEFAKMSQDEINQLIQKYDRQIKPESYSRKEGDTI